MNNLIKINFTANRSVKELTRIATTEIVCAT